MNSNNRVWVIMAISIVGLVVTYVLATQVVPKAMVTFTKAAPSTRISLTESLVLGERILARADGSDSCKINVYILDDSSKGVAGKRVTLEGIEGISPDEVVSNNDGKAVFKVVSNIEGQYLLTAKVEGTELTKKIKVTFRN